MPSTWRLATLARFPDVRVTTHEATYEAGLRAPREPPGHGRQLVLFLGSNIGNFDPGEALGLLRRLADHLRPGDLVLLGADLVKPERDVLLAYDDPLGVTAAFDKNLLLRINAELGAEIDLASFTHEARWNASASRVEMHLVSARRQVIDIPRAGCRVGFERGESIWTESSYKFEPRGLEQLGARAGLTLQDQWVDGSAGFALTLFRRARRFGEASTSHLVRRRGLRLFCSSEIPFPPRKSDKTGGTPGCTGFIPLRLANQAPRPHVLTGM